MNTNEIIHEIDIHLKAAHRLQAQLKEALIPADPVTRARKIAAEMRGAGFSPSKGSSGRRLDASEEALVIHMLKAKSIDGSQRYTVQQIVEQVKISRQRVYQIRNENHLKGYHRPAGFGTKHEHDRAA